MADYSRPPFPASQFDLRYVSDKSIRPRMYGPMRCTTESVASYTVHKLFRSPFLRMAAFTQPPSAPLIFPLVRDLRIERGYNWTPLIDPNYGVCAYIFNRSSTYTSVNNISILPYFSTTLTSRGYSRPAPNKGLVWWEGGSNGTYEYLNFMPTSLPTDKLLGPMYSSRDSKLHVRNDGPIDDEWEDSYFFTANSTFSYYLLDRGFFDVSGRNDIAFKPPCWAVIACKNCAPVGFGNVMVTGYGSKSITDCSDYGLYYYEDSNKMRWAYRRSPSDNVSIACTTEEVSVDDPSTVVTKESTREAYMVQGIQSIGVSGDYRLYYLWSQPGTIMAPSADEYAACSPPIVKLRFSGSQGDTATCFLVQYCTEFNF